MKKIMSNLLFLAFSFLFLSACNHADKETLAFQKYLNETFNKKIPMEKHYYLLCPGTQCKGCNFFDADKLDVGINQKFTVITTYPPHNFKGFYHFLEDTTGILEALPLVNYSNKLIITKGGQVKSITLVYNLYRQLDSLNNF